MKRSVLLLSAISFIAFSSAQTTHYIEHTGEAFVPDTLNLAPGDSIHVTVPEDHSMVQVIQKAWEQEVVAGVGGISVGSGTINVGVIHIFPMHNEGTFYFLCQQHPWEKGVIRVDEQFVGIHEISLPSLEMHPVPASDRLTIGSAVPYATIKLEDRQGRHVHSYEPPAHNVIDVSGLPAGIYFITLLDRTGAPVARDRMVVSR